MRVNTMDLSAGWACVSSVGETLRSSTIFAILHRILCLLRRSWIGGENKYWLVGFTVARMDIFVTQCFGGGTTPRAEHGLQDY